MGHNVSSSKTVVVHSRTSGSVDRQTENGIINSTNSSLVVENGSPVGTLERTKEYNVKVEGDTRMCDITGCCLLADGCLVMSDFTNKRLKKLNPSLSEVNFIGLPDGPSDVCYLGKSENRVVVCIGNTLHFVCVKGKMKLQKSVKLPHKCNGITSYGGHLYVVDDSSVMKYTNSGEKREMLYTGSTSSGFRHITSSAKGTEFYITDERSGLLTIDSSGQILATLTDQDLKEAEGVCVNSDGIVLVSGYESDTVIKVDRSGKKKIATVIQDNGDITDPKCLCVGSQNSKLYVGQWSDKLTVFDMK